MCIIATGAKKNMLRPELVQGMKSNPSGFYMAVLNPADKSHPIKEQIRTLSKTEALKVFDAALPDDIIVSHSRIPSHGGNNINNVHGWSKEGVTFMHNGTMTNVINVMPKEDPRTDSQFFFEEIFIPIYISQGRKFTRLVKLICESFTGYNSKFLFIMPDGEVITLGNFISDHQCKFSNSSYKVPTVYPSYPYYGFDSRLAEKDRTPFKFTSSSATYSPPPEKKKDDDKKVVTPKDDQADGQYIASIEDYTKLFLARMALSSVNEVKDDAIRGNHRFRSIRPYLKSRYEYRRDAAEEADDAAGMDNIASLDTQFLGFIDKMSKKRMSEEALLTTICEIADEIDNSILECMPPFTRSRQIVTDDNMAVASDDCDEQPYDVIQDWLRLTEADALRECQMVIDYEATEFTDFITAYEMRYLGNKRAPEPVRMQTYEVWGSDNTSESHILIANLKGLFNLAVKEGAKE